MNSIKFNKRIGGKKQLGQGMTEYIIIVALVAIVVTRAIKTIMANSVGEMIFRSRPMLSTISSISPRVFISTPSAAASREAKPVASRQTLPVYKMRPGNGGNGCAE